MRGRRQTAAGETSGGTRSSISGSKVMTDSVPDVNGASTIIVSRPGLYRSAASVAQGSSAISGTPPVASKADSSARNYGESRKFGSDGSWGGWRSRREECIALLRGSANIKDRPYTTRTLRVGRSTPGRGPARFPASWIWPIGNLARPDRAAQRQRTVHLDFQVGPHSPTLEFRTPRLRRISPHQGTGSSKSFRVSYALSFPIPPWRVFRINYGVDFGPTG